MDHQLRWLGHAAWELTTGSGTVALFDPWLTGNPKAAATINELQADFVLITHDHFDHASDLPAVVEQTGATAIAQPETIAHYKELGVPEDKAIDMNIGGTVAAGDLKVTMVEAYHSSATGTAAGYIVTLPDGRRLYNAGDTGIHANMAVWGELYPLDVAILPIGDHYTMDGYQAAHAVAMLKPRIAVPQHFGTFPLLAPSADEFVRHTSQQAPDTQVVVLEPGETYKF